MTFVLTFAVRVRGYQIARRHKVKEKSKEKAEAQGAEQGERQAASECHTRAEAFILI